MVTGADPPILGLFPRPSCAMLQKINFVGQQTIVNRQVVITERPQGKVAEGGCFG